MQQYILIPEIPVIIRKIAPDGHHCAYWEQGHSAANRARIWCDRLTNGESREAILTWSTHNIYNGPSINLTFKENSNG